VLKNSSGLPAAVEKQLKRESAVQMKNQGAGVSVAKKFAQGSRIEKNRSIRTGAENGKTDRTKKENRGTGRTFK